MPPPPVSGLTMKTLTSVRLRTSAPNPAGRPRGRGMVPRRGQGDRSKARLTHRRNDGLSSSILPTSSTTNTFLPPPLAEPTCRRGKGHDLQQVIGDLVTLLGGVALPYGAEKGEGQLLKGRQVHHIRAHCARPSALGWTGHVPGNTNRVKTWLRGGRG